MKSQYEVVRLSTKGQVVIPKPIRDKFSLTADDKLLVVASEQGILLQKVDVADAKKKLKVLLNSFQKQFAEQGITEEDIRKEVEAVHSDTSSA